MSQPPKVALVCDWLTNFAGAEQVLLALTEIFPEAPIYTTVYNPERVTAFRDKQVITSYLQHWPWSQKHQLYAPWRPAAVESLDLSDYEIVISSSSAESKGVITKPHTRHYCYCHTPTRYFWSDYHEYQSRLEFGWLNPLVKMFMPRMINKLRIWDRLAADRVDTFIANSQFVAQRIRKYYEREAVVIHPPVRTERFRLAHSGGDYYLAVGRLIPYKAFDLLVHAFNANGLKLKIAGTGPEYAKLKELARPNIEFLGYVPDKELPTLYAHCRAFLFPQVEDFGITPLEAMASGRPVIALGRGGALETVVEGKTGTFFSEQTVDALNNTLRAFNPDKLSPSHIRAHAEKFSLEVFKNNLLATVH